MTYDLNITFDDNLVTGNNTIDTQHKELIDRIRNFVVACQNGDSKVKAIKMLDYLDEYTDFHFKEEEELQEKAGYPERGKHHEKHEEFKKSIQELYEYLQDYEGPTDQFCELVQKNVVAKNPNVFAVLNGHYHGSSYETVMFDDDGDGKNDRTVYQICTDYQSGFEGGNEYIKFLYFDLDNNKIYMNSYSPCMDDFNYYDTDVHTLNVEGASATGVDEMVLDVEFNTNEQTILEKSFNAYVYTNEEIGTANVDSSTGKAVLQVNNLEANTGYKWYAVVTNAATGVKRSGVYEFTTAKKNTDVITDDSQDTSDKSGNIIATGDNARIWVYILVGMSAIAVGIVSVKKKKEA